MGAARTLGPRNLPFFAGGIVLSGALLLPSPARADDVAPTQEEPAAKEDAPPLRVADSRKYAMRNPDILVLGIALSALGVGCFAYPLTWDRRSRDSHDWDDAQRALMIGSLTAFAVGIPAIVYGAKRVPVENASLLPSRVGVGPLAAEATWVF